MDQYIVINIIKSLGLSQTMSFTNSSFKIRFQAKVGGNSVIYISNSIGGIYAGARIEQRSF